MPVPFVTEPLCLQPGLGPHLAAIEQKFEDLNVLKCKGEHLFPEGPVKSHRLS